MVERADFRLAVDQFADWRWRLNNLYYIANKVGHKELFRLNWAQERLFENMHFQNVILKARQLGFTTFIQMFMLDACLFNSNIRAGTIAHTLDDAKVIFRDKVKFPYDNLPDAMKGPTGRPIEFDNATELMLANNSSIRVGTSLRSGTLQYLHISEYGKICAKYPEKAREVRTGALNTVQSGQIVFVESTAEGQEGHFFDICEAAQTKQRTKAPLTPLDFKFHFFPWWENPEYELDPAGVVITDQFAKYFGRLKDEHGIALNGRKQAWYVKKAETQLDDMKREFPSTAAEAFEASVEGAYFAEQMAKAEFDGRIGKFPLVSGVPVETAWDIGIGDYTSIWLYQRVGARFRFVGYVQNSGEGLPYYVEDLKARNIAYSSHYWPHDGVVDEWGSGKSRIEQARELGFKPSIVPRMLVDDGINAARTVLAHCEFDEAACSEGLKAMRSYRKDWDEERGVWKDKPRHDWASHGADAFRTFATQYKRTPQAPPVPPKQDKLLYEVKDGRVVANMSVMEIVKMKMKKKARD
jgi:hypothetical protein